MAQDVRGKEDSNGVLNPFVNAAEGGFETHEWIGRHITIQEAK